MTHVVVAPEARIDLLQILAYLGTVAGSGVADKWDRKLWKAIDDLAEFAGAGAPRPVLGNHARIVPMYPYVLIYDHVLGSDVVHLLRVVHGRRNIFKEMLRR